MCLKAARGRVHSLLELPAQAPPVPRPVTNVAMEGGLQLQPFSGYNHEDMEPTQAECQRIHALSRALNERTVNQRSRQTRGFSLTNNDTVWQPGPEEVCVEALLQC